MSEIKKFSITFNKKFREVAGGYLIIDQLNNQVNFFLGRGTWYAESYQAQENDDGTITLIVAAKKVLI